jgi:ribonuclease-3
MPHNEALEFLGDSVFGFLVSSMVFRRYPDRSEGELSKAKAYLVSAANLVQLAKQIGLGEFLRLSRGEEKTGGRAKRAILVDAYEALIGAVYLDGGIEAAASLVRQHMAGRMVEHDEGRVRYGDFKSALQERLHDLGQAEPVYSVVQEIGPDHSKLFVVQITVSDQRIAEGRGRSKKEAQQEAARLALGTLQRPTETVPPERCGS